MSYNIAVINTDNNYKKAKIERGFYSGLSVLFSGLAIKQYIKPISLEADSMIRTGAQLFLENPLLIGSSTVLVCIGMAYYQHRKLRSYEKSIKNGQTPNI